MPLLPVSTSTCVVATATATFLIGHFPGGNGPDASLIGQYIPAADDRSFASLLRLNDDAAHPALAADNPAAIGWESGP